MNEEINFLRKLWKLALVNSGLWAIAIAAWVFVIQESPGAKGFFTILAGGSVVATVLVSALFKLR